MGRLLARFGLSRDELSRTLPITLGYGLVLASLYLLKPARNALFLNRQGIDELPFVLLLVAVVGGLTAAIYGRYAKATRIDRLIRITFVVLIGFLFGFRYLLTTGWSWVVYAFYVWVALYGLLTTSLVWLLANSVFTSREARKVFGFIGTGGIAGAIVGGVFTGGAAEALGTENLLLVCAGVLAVVIGILYPLQPTEAPTRRRRGQEPKSNDGLGGILQSPLLKNLALTAGLIATVAVIVDIQFNEIVDRTYPAEDDKTAFFGTFFAYLSGFGFLFQLFVTPILLRSVGVGIAVMILPAAMGLGSGAILLAPGLLSAILAKGADGGFRHSVHKAASEVLFLPVPPEAKNQAKLFLDTTVDTAFTGLGALLVLALTGPMGLSHTQLSFVTVPLVGLVIFVALRMRRAYLDAFRHALERRELDLEDLRTNLDEAGVVNALLPALDSANERQVVYALDLLASARARAIAEAVQPLLTHDSAEVREKALRVLQNQGTPPPEAALVDLIDDEDPLVRLEAMTLLCEADARPAAQVLEGYLECDVPDRIAAALGTLARRNTEQGRALLTPARVEAFLSVDSVEVHAALARALAGTTDPELATQFWALAEAPEPRVVEAAVSGLGEKRSVDAVPWLIDRLGDRALRQDARRALVECGVDAVPALRAQLQDTARSEPARVAITRALGEIPHQDAVDALLAALPVAPPMIRRGLVRALARLRDAYPDLRFHKELVFEEILREARVLYADRQAQAVLGAHDDRPPEARLLRRALRERRTRTLELLFWLMGLRYAPRDMANAYQGLLSEKKAVRASALEFLDNLLKKRIREVLLPLVEPNEVQEVRDHAKLLFGETLETRQHVLTFLLSGDDPWLKACALATMDEAERATHAELVAQARTDAHPAVREAAA